MIWSVFLLLLLAVTACGSHQVVQEGSAPTPLPTAVLETRIGPGCLTLASDHRVAITSVLSDSTYGYVEDSRRTWRIEWCWGMCDMLAHQGVSPTLFVYFWVDPQHSESIDHLSTVVSSYSRREHPETCVCPYDEAPADDQDWVNGVCCQLPTRTADDPAVGVTR
jgi:hypothetical protein